MKYTLSDLIDIQKMQKLTDSFYKITGIPSFIIADDGIIVTSSGWQEICINYHRKHPELKKACITSGVRTAERLREGSPYVIYKCPYGLINAAAPIILDGNHLAYFLIGQFLHRKPNQDEIAYFKQQATKFGFDESAYLDALRKIPIIPEERIGSILDFLVRFAAMIAEMGLPRLNQEKTSLALHESEERYRTLQENLPVGIFRTTPEGKIIAVNPATLKMLRYESADDLMVVPVYDLYAEPERRDVFLDRLKAEGKIEDFEVKFKRKDGTTFWVSISATLVTDWDGNFTYIDGMLQDVTERKLAELEKSKLQDQLRQAQKMEAIGTLAGGIAHDFNNILTSIMGYTEIAQIGVGKGSRLYKYLEEVTKASERAKDLVQQILTFSRQSKQELKPVKLKLIAKEALGLLRAAMPATIEIHQDLRSNAAVLANPTQIHQVFMNLGANAAYAMREKGGVLEVKLVDAELDSAAVASYPDLKAGSYLKLTVRDTGYGIPPHVLERIFDPFFTTKERGEGSGMGLSMVHGIVKSCGGSITVQSALGKGTVFTILLPVMERFTEMRTSQDEPIPKGTERILFVDDEEPVADLGYHMLTALGYDVVTKTSAFEALELFGAEPHRFDLVITDMTMPKITGVELGREIMRIKPDIPIILCTGFSDTIDEKKAKEVGFRAFVPKPIQMRNMAEIIRRVFSKKI